MSVFETYSKRLKKREQAGQPDVYQYDELPDAFRVQVIHIWKDAIGAGEVSTPSSEWWALIHGQMCRELGVRELSEMGNESFDKTRRFLLHCPTLSALDVIELSFRVIDRVVREYLERRAYGPWLQAPDDAIAELNHRFREHGIGYEFASGELIRKDSQFLHAEAVQPALQLLAEAGFAGPSDEFLRAHEHYRHGRHKEAIVEALKAFESTMKAICDGHQWAYNPTDAAKRLITVILDNGLIPPFLSSQLTALAAVLEGLPTVRNKLAGHGQGAEPTEVPGYFVAYALHLAATNIVMLVEAHQAKK